MTTATTISLPYNTPLSTIENTAVASWSGFVYQGLCALHHTLMLLKSDWDLAIGKYLSLEAYEDFAILDSTCKIESLHQCKCYSSPSDFTNECKKMADKEFYWKNVKRALSDAYKGMFFHSNQDNTLDCGVKAYTFFSGKTKIGPFEIYALVEVVVQDILKCRRIAGSSNAKTTIVGTITDAQLTKIAEYKMPDLNCYDVEAAKKIVAGTARNLGIAIKD